MAGAVAEGVDIGQFLDQLLGYLRDCGVAAQHGPCQVDLAECEPLLRDSTAADGTRKWLLDVGTGDVLAGIIAAMRAAGLPAFEAAQAGTWLHGRAAQLAGTGFIADDLVAQVRHAFTECV